MIKASKLNHFVSYLSILCKYIIKFKPVFLIYFWDCWHGIPNDRPNELHAGFTTVPFKYLFEDILIFNFGFSNGGLSQWGRSNRPRIGPGTVKSLNAPWELS